MSLPVRAFGDAVLGIAGPVQEFARPDGATLADLIGLVVLEHEAIRLHLRVRLNGDLIAPELYHRVRPKGDCLVTIAVPVHGGGGDGNKVLTTVAAIALIGASLFVGGFGLPFLGTAFAAGSVGANLIASGLSLAASMLLQGLNVPRSTSSDSVAAREVGVASANNAFEPGAYLQRVIGMRKVTPQMVMPPYVEIEGDNQYVTAVYALAGPHQIDQVRIGTAELTSAADVSIETRPGFATDAPLTLVSDTRIESGLNMRLSEFQLREDGTNAPLYVDVSLADYAPYWHRMETKYAPDKVRIFIQFDSGLMQVKNGTTGTPAAAVTALRFRLRRKGATTWSNLPEFVARGIQSAGAIRLMLDFEWRATVDMPGSVTAFTANYGGWSWKYDSVVDSIGSPIYWTADSYYAGKVDFISAQRLVVYLDTTNFPQDTYEIEVRRGFAVEESLFTSASHDISWSIAFGLKPDDFFTAGTAAGSGGALVLRRSPVDFVQTASVLSIQSIWNEYPFDCTGQPTALIAIRAKNRSIDQVTCRAAGYTEDWDGANWVADRVTSNPASWYREVLRGDLNAEPVPDSLIDIASLQDWHEWCEAQGIEVNAVLQGQPITEVLSLIAQAGLARPRYAASHGVVIDRPRDPVLLVTQRNASGFGFEKAFAKIPHALKVNLVDEARGYEVREIIVYADGYNADGSGGMIEATRFESATYRGISNEAQIIDRARRDLRFIRHRSRRLSWTMDIEHLEFAIGDLVYLETDILGQIGGRGRVREVLYSGGLVSGLRLDEERDFTGADAAAATRAVAMRLIDGTIRTEAVTGDDSDRTIVQFATPFAMPASGGNDLIMPGVLVATGSLGQEARKTLVWDIAPGPDLTASLVGLDYAEADIFDHLLLETGDHLVLEEGGYLNTAETDDLSIVRLETGVALRLESGAYLIGD